MKKYLFILIALIIVSCDKEYDFLGETQRAVTTVEIVEVLQKSARVKAVLNTDNGSYLIEKGICYSTNSNPTTSDFRKQDSDLSFGSYSVLLNNLTSGTKYYVKAYAKNAQGTAYGEELTFTTSPAIPASISITSINNVTTTTSTFAWGCNNSWVGTSTSFGTGNQNTNTIYSYCGYSSGGGYVYNYASGGYSNWFLPSVSELEKIYYNKYALALSSVNYWTSSEASTTTAFMINFNNGTTSSISKTIYNYVLPIRKF